MESTRKDDSDPGRAGPWRVWTGRTWETQGSVEITRFRAPPPPPTPTPTAPLTPPPTPPPLPWWGDPGLGGRLGPPEELRPQQFGPPLGLENRRDDGGGLSFYDLYLAEQGYPS